MVKTKMNGGCSYGKVSRNMLENLKESMDKGFTGFNKRLEKIDETQTELFNHQSSRLPMWVTILFTIGGSILTGLIVWAITS